MKASFHEKNVLRENFSKFQLRMMITFHSMNAKYFFLRKWLSHYYQFITDWHSFGEAEYELELSIRKIKLVSILYLTDSTNSNLLCINFSLNYGVLGCRPFNYTTIGLRWECILKALYYSWRDAFYVQFGLQQFIAVAVLRN